MYTIGFLRLIPVSGRDVLCLMSPLECMRGSDDVAAVAIVQSLSCLLRVIWVAVWIIWKVRGKAFAFHFPALVISCLFVSAFDDEQFVVDEAST